MVSVLRWQPIGPETEEKEEDEVVTLQEQQQQELLEQGKIANEAQFLALKQMSINKSSATKATVLLHSKSSSSSHRQCSL